MRKLGRLLHWLPRWSLLTAGTPYPDQRRRGSSTSTRWRAPAPQTVLAHGRHEQRPSRHRRAVSRELLVAGGARRTRSKHGQRRAAVLAALPSSRGSTALRRSDAIPAPKRLTRPPLGTEGHLSAQVVEIVVSRARVRVSPSTKVLHTRARGRGAQATGRAPRRRRRRAGRRPSGQRPVRHQHEGLITGAGAVPS
jgi:hypothetical protein